MKRRLDDVSVMSREELICLIDRAKSRLACEGALIAQQVPDDIWFTVLRLVLAEDQRYHAWLFVLPLVSKRMNQLAHAMIRECYRLNPGTSPRVMNHFDDAETLQLVRTHGPRTTETLLRMSSSLSALSLMYTGIDDTLIRQFTRLTNLQAMGENLVGDDALRSMTNLTALVDWRRAVDTDFSYLQHLPYLTALNLHNTIATPGLEKIVPLLVQLTALSLPLFRCRGTEPIFINFALLTNLRSLALTDQCDAASVDTVSQLTWLTELDVFGAPAVLDTLLKPLCQLRILSITMCRSLTDDALTEMTGLRELYCDDSRIGDDAIKQLTALQVLECTGSRCTADGYSHLTALEILSYRPRVDELRSTGSTFAMLTQLRMLRTRLAPHSSLTHLTRLQWLDHPGALHSSIELPPKVIVFDPIGNDNDYMYYETFCYRFNRESSRVFYLSDRSQTIPSDPGPYENK